MKLSHIYIYSYYYRSLPTGYNGNGSTYGIDARYINDLNIKGEEGQIILYQCLFLITTQ